jgi:tRNA (cytidine32/uridine32-2'-O)-methyltransferase
MTLDRIHIVLSHPTHPGNVGAVARAMKNMGLRRLTLLNPPADFRSGEARARAAGADDLLDQARVCGSLDEALTDASLVIGTSARERAIAWPHLSPNEAGQRLVSESAHAPVALLFGQERSGLTNSELDRCHYVVSIPADPSFPSLNLACAVQVLAYEVRVASSSGSAPLTTPSRLEDAASDAELQLLYRHLEDVLIEIDFLDPANPRKLMRRLMRLFNRAHLDKNELNILRGILTGVQQRRPKNT